MTLTTYPFVKPQFFTNPGVVAAGYQLFAYEAGTTTKADTYSDAAGTTLNTNPIILDSAGRASIFLLAQTYKFVLAPPTDTDPPTSPVWTMDGILPGQLNTNFDLVGTAGEAIGPDRMAYISDGSGGKTAGRWYATDNANYYSSVGARMVGINVTGAVTSNGDSMTIRLLGRVTGQAGLTAGDNLFIDAAGAIIAVQPAYNARVGAVADSTTSFVIPIPPPFLGTMLKGFAFGSGQGNAGGGGDTQLTSYDVTIEGGSIPQPGDTLIAEGTWTVVNNGNTKTAKMQIGGGTLVTIATIAAGSAQIVPFRMVIRRRTSTTASITGISWIGAAAAGAPTNYLVNNAVTTVDWTIDQTLKIFAASTTAADLVLTDYSVVLAKGAVGVTV